MRCTLRVALVATTLQLNDRKQLSCRCLHQMPAAKRIALFRWVWVVWHTPQCTFIRHITQILCNKILFKYLYRQVYITNPFSDPPDIINNVHVMQSNSSGDPRLSKRLYSCSSSEDAAESSATNPMLDPYLQQY